MKRIIKTFETCSDELLGQLAEKFPKGIKDRHLTPITTLKGEKIKVVELQTEDAMYLIKFSDKLEEAIDNYDLDMDDEDNVDVGFDDEDLDANLIEAENIPDEDLAEMTDDDDDED